MNRLNQQVKEIVEEIAKSLDINPNEYKKAVDSYNTVGKWLADGFKENAYPQCNNEPDIYPQGSINLGTIIKPLKDDKESDYDVDIVCELKNEFGMTARMVKGQVGDRLKENGTYNSKLDDEGKRCWTLSYNNFHIDILPCVPDDQIRSNIKLTHKCQNNANNYEWRYGNPKKYGEWFKTKNISNSYQNDYQKLNLQKSYSMLFESIDKVPDQLVRISPLQRSIQIMKRHRDVYFKTSKHKPISIILTTLAAKIYRGETDTYTALSNIITTLSKHSGLMQDMYFSKSLNESISLLELITRRKRSDDVIEWYIPNPVNSKENFADRWHEENNARAKAFFEWLDAVKSDLDRFKEINMSNAVVGFVNKIFYCKLSDVFVGTISKVDSQNTETALINDKYYSYRNTEELIDYYYNVKINPSYDFKINCLITQDGWSSKTLLSKIPFIHQKKKLEFFFEECNIPRPFKIKWKVRNIGTEAIKRDCIRGQIKDDKGYAKLNETSDFSGQHYVECYIIKDNICVAKDRITVPIATM